MSKKSLSESDICDRFITPSLLKAGWDQSRWRREYAFTDGRIIVRGKLVARGKQKRADYLLFYKSNLPIAVIEAKDNNHSLGAGMQQGLGYSVTLDVPFVFSSNGDGFLFHDKTGNADKVETVLSLEEFPTPDELWHRYMQWKGLNETNEVLVTSPNHQDVGDKAARYYQQLAINRTIEAVARGQKRVLLAMATGSADWKNLYGNRSLAESLNSVLKNDLGRGERARSLNLNHQWIDLMVMLLMRNDQSLVLYRRRTQLARTASPPAA